MAKTMTALADAFRRLKGTVIEIDIATNGAHSVHRNWYDRRLGNLCSSRITLPHSAYFGHSYELLRNAPRQQRKCVRWIPLLRSRFPTRRRASRHNQLIRASRL